MELSTGEVDSFGFLDDGLRLAKEKNAQVGAVSCAELLTNHLKLTVATVSNEDAETPVYMNVCEGIISGIPVHAPSLARADENAAISAVVNRHRRYIVENVDVGVLKITMTLN